MGQEVPVNRELVVDLTITRLNCELVENVG